MSVYVCRYLGASGVQNIEIEANTREEALSQLRTKGKPISIAEKEAKSQDITFGSGKKRIKTRDLAIFCKQMGVMISSGIPLNNAIGILENQTENKTMKDVLKQLDSQLKEGNQLSVAMRTHGDVFPPLLINMIEAGEKTGNLDAVLEKMSVHYTKELRINNQVRGAMIYPAVLLFLTVIAVIIMMVVVVPMFKGMFAEAGAELPGITLFVLGVSDFLTNYWYILLAVVIVAAYLLRRYIKTPQGRRQFDQMRMNAPMIKGAMQKIITARFSSTLSILMSAGIPLVDALGAAASTTNNAIVENRIGFANEDVQKGRAITDVLTQTDLFPPMMLSMVKIGEESGSMESMLTKTADYYDEELDTAIKQLMSMIEPAMILLMGVLIGTIVASIMIPMFSIASAVQDAAK